MSEGASLMSAATFSSDRLRTALIALHDILIQQKHAPFRRIERASDSGIIFSAISFFRTLSRTQRSAKKQLCLQVSVTANKREKKKRQSDAENSVIVPLCTSVGLRSVMFVTQPVPSAILQ